MHTDPRAFIEQEGYISSNIKVMLGSFMPPINLEQLPHYTYDDYAKWEGRWELIHGIPYAMTPAPTIRHQRVSQKIAAVLEGALLACEACQPLLAVDWKISEDTVVQPDNLVICFPAEGAYLNRAPALIFEVLSPSTGHKDRGLKFSLYEREGVKYYVIVDPQDNVAKAYQLRDGHYAKLADVVEETVSFDLGECTLDFDFSRIWPE